MAELPPVGSLAIIVNADNSEELSLKQVRSVFLGRRILWGSRQEAIAVVLQPKGTPASNIFNQHFFSDKGRRLSRQWIKNVVIGAAPAPTTLNQDIGVLALVREDKNAIGYVVITEKNSVNDFLGVRIFFILPEQETR